MNQFKVNKNGNKPTFPIDTGRKLNVHKTFRRRRVYWVSGDFLVLNRKLKSSYLIVPGLLLLAEISFL